MEGMRRQPDAARRLGPLAARAAAIAMALLAGAGAAARGEDSLGGGAQPAAATRPAAAEVTGAREDGADADAPAPADGAQAREEPAKDAEQAGELGVQRPRVRAVRVEAPPEIDGVLDDDVWERAEVIDEFTQVDPEEGAPASERTEARVVYDERALYIGIRCFDSDVSGIRATQMQRDAGLGFDDVLTISLDPYYKRRDGFYFQMNPAGAKRDALIEENRNLRFDWDGIWDGRASIDEQGWSVEIAIPYNTISFNPSTTTWGFNVQRVIQRKLETVRWSAPIRGRGMAAVRDAGVLEELTDLRQGVGLDVKPFVAATYRHDEGREVDDVDVDPGLDIFYKLTPELTFALTFNTDFAEADVDQRRVNLTRFSLFFPEQRDFFLQDAGVFSFGGIGRNPLPFFSRRIGISPEGRPLDIIYGAKLTGRTGNLNLGLLNVQVDSGDGLEQKNLSVGRVAANVLEESTAGVIFTAGDPQTNGDNGLIGADFNYRNSRDFGADVVEAHAYVQRTFTPDLEGDEHAFGGSVRYNSDVFQWRAFFTHIGEDYNPALGFSNRRGIREYILSGRQRWRPDGDLRRVDYSASGSMITNLDDTLETARLTPLEIDVEWDSGDRVEIFYRREFERLFDTFQISEGVVIPVGEYDFDRFGAEVSTSRTREIRGRARITTGTFFSGERIDLFTSLDWRPSRFLALSAEYEQSDVDLPEGEFLTQITRGSVDVAFSPGVSWNTTIQWDSVSELLGINSRVKWIVEPGQEVFFVVNQGFDTSTSGADPTVTDATIKVGLTLRY